MHCGACGVRVMWSEGYVAPMVKHQPAASPAPGLTNQVSQNTTSVRVVVICDAVNITMLEKLVQDGRKS